MNVAAAVASGGVALGSESVTPGPVLYLCLEDPTAALQERLESVLRGRPDMPFYYQTVWPALDAGGLGAIEGWLEQHSDARLIVIDTLASVAPAPDARKAMYQADYDSLKGLQRIAAARPGLAIIVNTHSRKAESSDALDEISGTTGKPGAVDHVWVLKRTRGENEAELHIQPRRAASSVRVLTFDSQLATWRIGGDAEASKAARYRHEIIEALADDGLYPGDIAATLGADTKSEEGQVRKQLGVLVKQGMIKSERGKYALTKLGQRSLDDTSEKIPGDQRIRDQTSKEGFRGIEGFDQPVQQGLIPDPLIPSDFSVHGDQGTDKEQELDRILRHMDRQKRFYVRLQLNSNKADDQTRARATCEEYGSDYTAAYRLIRGSEPPQALSEV